MNQQTKTVVIVGSIVSVLLLATIIVVSVLIATMNAQADEAEYRACMSTMGVGPGGTTDVDDMVEAADYCMKR